MLTQLNQGLPPKGTGVRVIATSDLNMFILESNQIEGIQPCILRLAAEQPAYERFLARTSLDVPALCTLVAALQPDAALRDTKGMDVRVGNHIPIRGGPVVARRARDIMADASRTDACPWRVHMAYEYLHPFMDGNGRSGRAVWLWMMLHRGLYAPELRFLHHWYYQTLRVAKAS